MEKKMRKALKTPVEIFGYPIGNRSLEAEAARSSYGCPFIGPRCTKQSRLLPYPPGVCSVWHKGNAIIICPERFRQDKYIFRVATELVFGTSKNITFIPQVKIKDFGTLDWVGIVEGSEGRIENFCGLEVQSDSTTQTGKLNEALEDFFRGELKERYGYNLNTYNTIKLSFTQMMTKGLVFEYWGKPYVWFVQEPLFRNMTKRFELHLHRDSAGGRRNLVFLVLRMQKGKEGKIYVLRHVDSFYAHVADLVDAFRRSVSVDLDTFERSLKKRLEDSSKTKVVL